MNTKADSECPICSRHSEDVLTTQMRRGKGTVYLCKNCNHGFFVTQEDLDAKEYYASEYRKEYSHNSEQAATNAKELFDVYKNYQKDRLSFILSNEKDSKTLLEVGASSGQFLYHLKDSFEVINAIELDLACCNFLKNELNIKADSEYLRESIFSNEIYDVVCSFQVLEHVPNPVDFLQDLKISSKVGHNIYVEVPNLNDPLLSVWSPQSYREFFYHSAHLHYFTEDSLMKVAIEAGFKEENIEIFYTQDYNLLNHLHWIMNDSPQDNCHTGLSEVKLEGKNNSISEWLTEELASLNKRYVNKLIENQSTSNMMMKIKNV